MTPLELLLIGSLPAMCLFAYWHGYAAAERKAKQDIVRTMEVMDYAHEQSLKVACKRWRRYADYLEQANAEMAAIHEFRTAARHNVGCGSN